MKRIQITMTLEVQDSDPAAVLHAIERELEREYGLGAGVLSRRGWKIVERSAREV